MKHSSGSRILIGGVGRENFREGIADGDLYGAHILFNVKMVILSVFLDPTLDPLLKKGHIHIQDLRFDNCLLYS